jgi:putative acetyltransferase
VAVRGTASRGYPLEVIEAWAPLPVDEDAVKRVLANADNEHRLIAEIHGRVVGIRAIVFETFELRACYVTPMAGGKGVGSALVREIETSAHRQGLDVLTLDSSVTAEPFYRKHGYEVSERGEHILRNGQHMA